MVELVPFHRHGSANPIKQAASQMLPVLRQVKGHMTHCFLTIYYSYSTAHIDTSKQ